MKIICSGNINSKSRMEHYFVEELRKQGHEVIAIDSRGITGVHRGLNFEDLIEQCNGISKGKIFQTFYWMLEKIIIDNEPDYYFSMNDKHIQPRIIEYIKHDTDTKTIGFFGDLTKSDYYTHYRDCFDVVLAPYEDARFPKVKKWTWACALPYIKKLDIAKDIDVLWYGSIYPNRMKALEYIDKELLSHMKRITFYGSGTANGEVWAEDLNTLINRAKVILHIDHPDVQAPTLRFYEILGSKNFLVSDTWYSSISHHKSTISLDEMINQIKKILTNTREMEVSYDQHWLEWSQFTMEFRVKEFLECLE